MMDFEVVKCRGTDESIMKLGHDQAATYKVSVNGNWYLVPKGFRNYNKPKLQAAFDRGEFKPVK
jgi:hypothetical protein